MNKKLRISIKLTLDANVELWVSYFKNKIKNQNLKAEILNIDLQRVIIIKSDNFKAKSELMQSIKIIHSNKFVEKVVDCLTGKEIILN